MIVEYIRYSIAAASADDFVAGYRAAAASLDASPHCLSYELTRCAEDPQLFTLRIVWDSMEGHLQGFRKGPHFGAFFAAIKPYVGNILEMQHYEPTAVARDKREAATA